MPQKFPNAYSQPQMDSSRPHPNLSNVTTITQISFLPGPSQLPHNLMPILTSYAHNPMSLGSISVPILGSNATMSTNGMTYNAYP